MNLHYPVPLFFAAIMIGTPSPAPSEFSGTPRTSPAIVSNLLNEHRRPGRLVIRRPTRNVVYSSVGSSVVESISRCRAGISPDCSPKFSASRRIETPTTFFDLAEDLCTSSTSSPLTVARFQPDEATCDKNRPNPKLLDVIAAAKLHPISHLPEKGPPLLKSCCGFEIPVALRASFDTRIKADLSSVVPIAVSIVPTHGIDSKNNKSCLLTLYGTDYMTYWVFDHVVEDCFWAIGKSRFVEQRAES